MTTKEKEFRPLKEELFFLEYDLDEMYDLWHHEIDGPKYQRLESYLWQMKPEDVAYFLKIFDNRWKRRVPDPIFALRLARYYFHPLRRLVSSLAGAVQHKYEPNRELVRVSFCSEVDRSYIDIDQHGTEDVSLWTQHKVERILHDVIVMENYKGNCFYLVPSGSKYSDVSDNMFAEHYTALKLLCDKFPDGIVKLSD